MRRTKNINPASAIITADLHVTEFTPICRTDNYIEAQKLKLDFLQQLSKNNAYCPILVAGDVFDKWRASPWFSAWAYKHLPRSMVAIPGNHDLPMHSFNQYDRSALHLMEQVLKETEGLTVLKNTHPHPQGNYIVFGAPFGEVVEPKDLDLKNIPEGTRKVLLLHQFIWAGKHKPSWATHSYTDREILGKFVGLVDIIITGDNHESFVTEQDGTLLINPGSMLRRTADQADFRPRCFLYYAQTNTVVPVEYPIKDGVISREHLDRQKSHDTRTAAYITRMQANWKGGLSFTKNLEIFFQANNTPKKVRELIYSVLEDS